MVETPLALLVIVGGALLFGVFFFFAYKIHQDRTRISVPALRMLLAVVLCFVIWAISVTILSLHFLQYNGAVASTQYEALQLSQRIIAAISAQYGAFLYYVAMKRMFKEKHPQSLMRYKGFWVTTLVVAMLIALDIRLKGYAPFDSSKPYTSDLFSNAEVILSYAHLLFWAALIIKVYLDVLKRNTQLTDQGRFVLCLVAFSLAFLGLLLVEVNLLLYVIFKNDDYRIFLNLLYHISLVVLVLFVVLSYIVPDTFFIRILSPLAAYKTLRQRRQQALLRSLHQTMVEIVPSVQLPCEPVHDLRILIEISDARQVIWSLQQRLKPIKPQDEAKYLLQLMRKNTILEAPGEYSPAPTSVKNIVKHNVIVAKRLQRLQKAM